MGKNDLFLVAKKLTTWLKMLTRIQDIHSRKQPHLDNVSTKPGSSPSSNSSSGTSSSSVQKVWTPSIDNPPLYLFSQPPTFDNFLTISSQRNTE